MPSAKQIQEARKKLKVTPRPKGNAPKIPSAALLRIINADPKIKRNREFVKRVNELIKNSKK
jgi:hypothetical protein|tara:strand:- start:306 stop:491 length:186 start_codon:yes stop_codon:yes gene_type:complete